MDKKSNHSLTMIGSALAKFTLLGSLVIGLAFTSYAQDEDSYDDYSSDGYDYSDDGYSSDGYDDYDNPDSTYSDDYSDDYSESDDYGDYGSYGSSSSGTEKFVPKKIVRKPYVRFVPPYDSIRELVLYKAVIEVKDREGYEVEIDTINWRTHQWLEAEFGKNLKKFLTSDGINNNAGEMEYKIKIHGTFVCEVEPNEFTKVKNGHVEYDMEIRVRDGRYRYTVKNLVHVAEPRPGEKEGERTYFEYLMKSEDNVQGGDKVLIAADKKITAMMDELQKICQTSPIEEEDDW